jgi:DedD protein
MEKKKLLLVAISVGIFLVISIGAAILVFAPKNTAPSSRAVSARPAGADAYGTDTGITLLPPSSFPLSGQEAAGQGTGGPVSVDPVELVRQPEEALGLKPYPEGTMPNGANYYAGGTVPSGGGTVINVPRPVAAAVPNAAPAGTATPVSAPQPAAQQAPAQPAARPAQPAARPTQPAARPVAAAASQPKPAVQPKIYDDYWVQTGAFSSLAKAEGVKETLSSKGIISIIENREIDGNTLFRVRVGPYTSQNEANYWLSLIKTINGFEDSQVRQTQR